jgi:transglutaminase-like putative cysteine protease
MIAVAQRFSVSHVTTYRYSTEVGASQSIVHLVPRDTANQRVVSSMVSCAPGATERHDYTDAFGNASCYLAVERPHQEWVVEAHSVVDVSSTAPPVSDVAWDDVAAALRSSRDADVAEMTMASVDVPFDRAIAAFASASFRPGSGVIESVRALTERIFAEFTFDPAATEVSTPVLSVLEQRRGVCQDFAHLAIAAIRSLGLAARYVSGYLETEPPLGTAKLVGADASHAWLAVWVPGTGWIDADPTNGYLPTDRHLTVAWGRDYTDVAPARGVVFGPPSTQQLDVSVDVVRISSD